MVVEGGVQLGGAGIEPNELRIGLLAADCAVTVAMDQLSSTEGEPLENPVVMTKGSAALEMPFTVADCAAKVDTPVSLCCEAVERPDSFAAEHRESKDRYERSEQVVRGAVALFADTEKVRDVDPRPRCAALGSS